MQVLRIKISHILVSGFCVALLLGMAPGTSAQKKVSKKKQAEKKAQQDELANSQTPDRVLYDRALDDMKHSRYTEGRLALQTLINTYPDSEYLAKAKLSLADSYFKEGGTSSLTQAIAEYKDFKTFFPFLDEAAYAQMQVGMCHYKMMEKADRDTSQAEFAESEFQAMLLEYPQSTIAPQAEQRLREVQEILADGEFKIARFYYGKVDYRAAAARLAEVTDRYPLYSQSDEALWMLADIYMKTRLTQKDEDYRNVMSAAAGQSYARLAKDYPLSKRTPEAKARLKAMGMAVPEPDPNAMARMQKEQSYAKEHHTSYAAILKGPVGMLKGAPDVSTAAHAGQPNLKPPDDTFAATEVLKPLSGGPSMNLGVTVQSGNSGGGAPSTPADTTAPSTSSGSSTQTPQVGAQIITSPAELTAATAPPASTAPAQAAPGSAVSPADAPAAAPAQPATGQTSDGTPQDQSPQAAPAGQPSSQSAQRTTDSKDESSSKKKKGVRKLIPW
jgi:outer membrane protein assembly factor BamD